MADTVTLTRTSHETLWAALCAAQAEFGAPERTKQGARSKYAPLEAVMDAVRPILNRHGLALTQPTHVEGETLYVETRITHAATGEFVTGSYPAGLVTAQHQILGGGLTYARRYSLLSLLGVQPEDEDDDGEKAGAAGTKREQVLNPDTGRMVNPNSSAQLKKSGAWESFKDKVQSFEDSRDSDGLNRWFKSQEVRERVSAWPQSWQDNANDEVTFAFDRIRAAEREGV